MCCNRDSICAKRSTRPGTAGIGRRRPAGAELQSSQGCGSFRPSMRPKWIAAALLTALGLWPAASLNAAEEIAHPFLCADYGQGKVFVVSAAGKVQWSYALRSPQDVWLLPNGNFLFSHVQGAIEITRQKNIVWQYKTAKGNEVHTCQPLPDGRVLIGECGACRLIEVDREGQIRKELKLTTTTKGTHLQMRIVRKTPAGSYLVSLTGEHVVGEYDGQGREIRRIAVPGNPYEALRLPNGNTLICCGDGHKLIEVDPQDKIVWRINENDLPGHPLRFVAGIQRLPNGDTVVCNWGGHGHVGEQPQIFEVTPQLQVVWQVFDNQQFRTISHIQLLDVPGDVTKGEILRQAARDGRTRTRETSPRAQPAASAGFSERPRRVRFATAVALRRILVSLRSKRSARRGKPREKDVPWQPRRALQ